MAREHNYDAYGERYWNLTKDQAQLAAALPIEFKRLRDVFDQASNDVGIKVKRVTWEKLHVLGVLEVDHSTKTWVMVKRGPRWQEFFDRHGLHVTKDTLSTKQLFEDIARIFDRIEI